MKYKFSKQKCARCIYRGINGLGVPTHVDDKTIRVYCNFATITNSTCLRPTDNNKVYDLRGTDYNNCKLFVEGEMLENDN